MNVHEKLAVLLIFLVVVTVLLLHIAVSSRIPSSPWQMVLPNLFKMSVLEMSSSELHHIIQYWVIISHCLVKNFSTHSMVVHILSLQNIHS